MNIYRKFIGGWNTVTVLNTVHRLNNQGMHVILDYVKENSNNEYESEIYKNKILDIANLTKSHIFAIKMSSMLKYENAKSLCSLLNSRDHKITIDAENVATYEEISDIANKLIFDFNKNNNNKINYLVIYKTYQMYRRDALVELMKDITYCRNNDISLGIKLVRGAYYNYDKDSGLLFNNIEDTHANYNEACRLILMNMSNTYNIRPIFATHNENSIELVQSISNNLLIDPSRYAFAQLLGMKDILSYNLAKNYTVYKYVPYGSICESVPYLIRRLHENPDMVKHMSIY